MNIIEEIKRVIRLESKSIERAQKAIGPAYAKAVQSILHCKGKVIVTGVGKSGAIAQKMASTLTSTGTPAIFLNPVEGSHGSLGVVHRNDIVFAIGKSGESEEILKIIPSIRRIGARIISMTSNPLSSLAKMADISLLNPVVREACPLNLAPTTSSSLAMVIGDAIAIALMKLRGFGVDNFALYHPGGLIGKQLLLKVSDVMRSGRRNPMVRVSSSVKQLLAEITRKWAGAASIVDKKGRLIGLVTDFDIRQAFAEEKKISHLKIIELMNPRPKFVCVDDLAIKALGIMENRPKPLTILPVVDKKKRSVGMLHLHDLVKEGLTRKISH